MDAMERAAEEEAAEPIPTPSSTACWQVCAAASSSDANKVKYEFDVLYENQRGLLVFGIPSSAPGRSSVGPFSWTSSNGKKSAYNIANAQLPDPSWEWRTASGTLT